MSFQYVWEWRLAATPDALWPYVADTNRLNRDAGIPVVTELPGAAPGTRRLLLRKYGVPVRWEEEPFEWVRPAQLRCAAPLRIRSGCCHARLHDAAARWGGWLRTAQRSNGHTT